MIVADRFVKPLFVVGDSHCIATNGLLLKDEASGVPFAVGESIFIPKIRADEVMADEVIHTGLIWALSGCCVLSHWPPPTSPERGLPHHGLLLAAHPWATSRDILILIGSIDARDVIRSVPIDAEIEMPFPVDLSALPHDGIDRVVSAAQVSELVMNHFRPLFRALVKLRSLGLVRLHLGALPPPTVDDQLFLDKHEIASRALVRYQVHLTINHTMRAFCAQSGIPFVDPWMDVTERNVVRDGWLPDGVHLGPAGAVATLMRFLESTMKVVVPS